jgi:hypothetical protein
MMLTSLPGPHAERNVLGARHELFEINEVAAFKMSSVER